MTETSLITINVGPKASALLSCACPMVLVGDYRNWLPRPPLRIENLLLVTFQASPSMHLSSKEVLADRARYALSP